MAVEKSALRITELDFDSIKNNLKTFLRSQSEFQDYDFEGSGMSVLLDILAYNTHYMAYYLNMVGNEMFLDTAQLRSSVISHAKMINYVPRSKRGAMAELDIVVTPSATEDNSTTTITLDKYTRLLGSDLDGVNYPFVTLYSNTATKSDGAFRFSNTNIRQGEVVTLQYLVEPENVQRRFEVPSANVDMDSISITVQASSSNTDTHEYTLADDITEITAASRVYFVEENENLNYTFYFGDGVLGKKPTDGNIVICTYLDTVGAVSNSVNEFTFVEPIAGLFSDNVVVNAAESSQGGVDKETIEQTRFRAPYFYTTQNRAVIDKDYETLLLKDYSYIDSVAVWGGEDNDPVIYGKVFMSIKTRGNYALTNLEKENIKNNLIRNRSIMTVTPEIIDPDYIYIVISGSVTYNQNLTSKSAEQIKELARAAAFDYNSTELNSFSTTFRKSKLQYEIENCEKSIVGSDIDVYIQKRIKIDTTKTKSYQIKFGMPILRRSVKSRLSSFPEIEVYDSVGISRDAFIEEIPEALTGIYSINVAAQGSGYSQNPTVVISGDGSGATATAQVIGGQLRSINITSAGTNYTTAIVSITDDSGSGASATVKPENEVGTLRTYYSTPEGKKVVINNSAGTIDYTEGTITIDSLRAYSVAENDLYNDDYLTILVPLDNENISPLRNRIVIIDENDSKSVQLSAISS